MVEIGENAHCICVGFLYIFFLHSILQREVLGRMSEGFGVYG